MNRISDIAHLVGTFQTLEAIINNTEAGKEANWQNLQQWLADNPKMQSRIDFITTHTADESINFLLSDFQITEGMLTFFDRQGLIREKAKGIIDAVATLYKERADNGSQKNL